MSQLNDHEVASNQAIELNQTQHTAAQEKTWSNEKSARKVQARRFTLSKADPRYWMQRIFKWHGSPNYSLQIQFRGRRMAFTLRTANKDAAARRAADIYSDLLALGVKATIAKHRTQSPREIPPEIASIG